MSCNGINYNVYSNNLYKFNNDATFYGAYAYLVNHKSLDKIINLISYVDMPIDIKYNKLYSNKMLDMYWITPIIVEPNFDLKSTILP